MTKSGLICVLLAAITAAPAQLATSHARPTDPVAPAVTEKPVVRVNGTVLTERDVVREMYAIFPYARQHNGFPKSAESQIRKGAIDMVIFEELVYQESQRRNMTIPPERISRSLSELRKKFSSEIEYQKFLKTEMHGSSAELRKSIRRSLLIEAMLNTEVTRPSVVTLAEAKADYTKHPERYRIPASIDFQSISIMPPENSNPQQRAEARKKAEDALAKARATKTYEEFGLLAEKLSEDNFRVNMGDHKATPREKLPPEIVQAADAMKPGMVSGLIQLDGNYTIFRLKAHVPKSVQPYEQVKDKLRQEMHQEKMEQLRSGFGKKLKQLAKIEYL